MALIDLTGRTFGRLIVLGRASNDGSHTRWKCLCACGARRVIYGQSLRSGVTVSCGCYRREIFVKRNTKHGLTETPEYNTWEGIIQRCTNRKGRDYKNYGGRGIKVCARWRRSFSAFLADVGHRPSPELSLDRIDNDGDYKPSNVRWATRAQQSANQRSAVYVEVNGQPMRVQDAAKALNISEKLVRDRLSRGRLTRTTP